jgi:hypothetical protein
VVTPTQSPPLTNTPTPSDQPATVTPVPSLTVGTGEASPTPVPSPTGGTGEASPTPDENQRYAEEDSNLKFEWGMLFDSVALFLSYIWLCCGGVLFLAIPLFFVVLWVASKRRQQQRE